MTDVGPKALIDLSALQHNVRVLVDRVAPSEVMLAVKANAYGHGMLEIARAGIASGATSLAALDVPAAIALREADVTVPILVWLHGVDTDFRGAIDGDIDLGISARWQLDAIKSSGAKRVARVHLKVDTGLSRNGATLDEWPELVRYALDLQDSGSVRIVAAWSHLADASEESDAAALAVFREAVGTAEKLGAHFERLHLAASSAGWRMPEARFDFVRFGIAAYGISPFDDSSGAELGLTPVMTLSATVSEINVGGSRHVRIAAGFADGVPTIGIPRASVLVAGDRMRVIEVDVDSMIVDPGRRRIEVGERALIFGPGSSGEATAEQWADWAETIADEVVTGIAPRVPRVYSGGIL
jgi:alanine racemase